MSEKRFTVIWKCEQINDKTHQECEYYIEMNGVERPLKDILAENEQLRNSIQSFLEEADIFSEEATDHDIVAYREMRKFDNKDAYYLACAIAELKKVINV